VKSAWHTAVDLQHRTAAAMDSTLDADRICELINTAHGQLEAAYYAEPQPSGQWRAVYAIVEDAFRRWKRRERARYVDECIDAVQSGMAAALARIPELFP
jgi:hypothetical protein